MGEKVEGNQRPGGGGGGGTIDIPSTNVCLSSLPAELMFDILS